MNLLVTGNTNIDTSDVVFDAFELLLNKELIPTDPDELNIVTCGSSGVEDFTSELADEYDIEVQIHPPDWSNLNHTPDNPVRIGYSPDGKQYNMWARNNILKTLMQRVDLVVIIWDGKSAQSRHVLKTANAMKKKVFVYNFKTRKYSESK